MWSKKYLWIVAAVAANAWAAGQVPVAGASWEELLGQATKLRKQRHYVEAENGYRAALQAVERFGGGPSDQRRATVLHAEANLQHDRRRFEEAESLYRQAFEILSANFPPNHPRVGNCLNNLALLHLDTGRPSEAKQLFRSVLESLKDNPESNRTFARATLNLGATYHQEGKFLLAEPLYREALAYGTKTPNSEAAFTARAFNYLGQLYYDLRRYTDAKAALKKSVALAKAEAKARPERLARALHDLALVDDALGKTAAAEANYLLAIETIEQIHGPYSLDLAKMIENLAGMQEGVLRFTEAVVTYSRVLRIREAALGPSHQMVLLSLDKLAKLHVARRNYKAAEPLARRSLSIWKETQEAGSLEHADRLNEFALILRKTGQKQEARRLREQAKSIRSQLRWKTSLLVRCRAQMVMHLSFLFYPK